MNDNLYCDTSRSRMIELRAELKKASEDYYNGNESMSNFEYDKKFDELAALESLLGTKGENFTDRVGAPAEKVNGLAKVTHEYEAKSLGKTKSIDELIKEQSKTSDGAEGYTCLSWKLDGSTIQLTYDHGKLQLAATRGDGEVGQDITKNAKYISGIPQEIKYNHKLVVRGEALMSYAEFERLNAEGEFANARNLANATISALDTKLLEERHIEFKAFELVDVENVSGLDRFSRRLDFLSDLNFGVVEHEKVKVSELKDVIERWSKPEHINKFDYPVDGLVVAYDDTTKTKDLQGTGHHPSPTKSMAFKWQDETIQTTLRNIEWSPSRTGLINPVAVFDTVELCGTKVSRASLHNLSYMENLNLKIGDRITVYKANMIIPQLAENLDRDNGKMMDYHSLGCPCCQQKVSIKENNGTKTVVCENEKCLAKELGTYTRFVDKHGMNIEGLSEKSILTLMENGIITKLSDFFTLGEKDRQKFVNIEGLGDKVFDNLLANIEKAKNVDTEHFLYACGIDGIGRGQLREIVPYLKENYDGALKEYQTEDGNYDLLGLLVNMRKDNFDFTKIVGIGDILAKSFSDFIERELIGSDKGFKECLPYLQLTDQPLAQNKDLPLSGKTFVITGKLEQFENRDAMVAYISTLGGKVAGSVSKNTDALINNDVTSTSGKNKKAQDLGIPIISEADFLKQYRDKDEIEHE